MTRDEQLIKGALDMAAETCEKYSYAADADGHHFAYSIRAIDPADVLAGLSPPATDAVAVLVETARWMRDQTCEGFCRDLPSAATYDKEMDIDCSGCRMRAALAAMEADHA